MASCSSPISLKYSLTAGGNGSFVLSQALTSGLAWTETGQYSLGVVSGAQLETVNSMVVSISGLCEILGFLLDDTAGLFRFEPFSEKDADEGLPQPDQNPFDHDPLPKNSSGLLSFSA
jgi:hypothetical protein